MSSVFPKQAKHFNHTKSKNVRRAHTDHYVNTGVLLTHLQYVPLFTWRTGAAPYRPMYVQLISSGVLPTQTDIMTQQERVRDSHTAF